MAKVEPLPPVDLALIRNIIKAELIAGGAAGVTQFDLLQTLDEKKCFSELVSDSYYLNLFQRHYILMHIVASLYESDAEAYWDMNVIRIVYVPSSVKNLNNSISAEISEQKSLLDSSFLAFLGRFYGDWGTYFQATEESAQKLIADFWVGFQKWQTGFDARAILGVSETADWQAIQAAYRKKIQLLHPDKGGDADSFQEIREAYEQLKAVLG